MILPLLQILGSKRAIDTIMWNDIDPADSMTAQDHKRSRGEPRGFRIPKLATALIGYCNYNGAAHTHDQTFACIDYFRLSDSD